MGVEGVSIVVLEEGSRAESISVCDTAHLGAHLAIRDHSRELPCAWGCPGMPSWNQEWFEPWQTEGQSRLAWRKLRVHGFSILGGGREQLGQWARELCCVCRPQCHLSVTRPGWWLHLVIARWSGLLLMHLLFQK